MYKAEWLYTVAVKCCATVVQRRSGECEKCRDKYININIYATVGELFSIETARGKKLFLCLEVLANSDLLRLPEGRSTIHAIHCHLGQCVNPPLCSGPELVSTPSTVYSTIPFI